MDWHRFHASASIALLRTLLICINIIFLVSSSAEIPRARSQVRLTDQWRRFIPIGHHRSKSADNFIGHHAWNELLGTVRSGKSHSQPIDHRRFSSLPRSDWPRLNHILHRFVCILVYDQRPHSVALHRKIRSLIFPDDLRSLVHILFSIRWWFFSSSLARFCWPLPF